MYALFIKPEADKIFVKLAKKNKKQLGIISKKIDELRTNPMHQYKFLRTPLQTFNRVHYRQTFCTNIQSKSSVLDHDICYCSTH